ncbi:MAG: YidB family protein [Pseudolabrys sp.]
MGLMDILNGMQNGPRGQTDPNAKGGMSPVTMAILALLAYKGIKHMGGSQAPGPGTPSSSTTANTGGLGDILGGLLGGGSAGTSAGGGQLGDLLKGGLGGLLAGGAAGSILSGGLGTLLNQFQQNGHGEAAKSWIASGPNQDISQSDLAKSIGLDDIEALSKQTGLSRDDLLTGLRQQLPELVDKLTPNGRLPTADEASRWV